MSELRGRITYSEFKEWLLFLELDTKEDYYLAQIAAEIRRANVKNPNTIKIKDFLIKYRSASEEKTAKSKSAWAKALRMELPK